MAAFNQHAAFSFWKAGLLADPKGYLKERSNQGGNSMGNFGRLTTLEDLPADQDIIDFIKQAAKLNQDGIKLPSQPKEPKSELIIPDYFKLALEENEMALATFESYSYSNKKDYINWITEAKTEKTRMERLGTAVQWMSEGKIRNWKYAK